MNTITGKVNAYMTKNSGIQIEDFKNPTADLISKLQYMTVFRRTDWQTACNQLRAAIMSALIHHDEWAIGPQTATITLKLTDQDAILRNKLSLLRVALIQHLADSKLVEHKIQDQIIELILQLYKTKL